MDIEKILIDVNDILVRSNKRKKYLSQDLKQIGKELIKAGIQLEDTNVFDEYEEGALIDTLSMLMHMIEDEYFYEDMEALSNEK